MPLTDDTKSTSGFRLDAGRNSTDGLCAHCCDVLLRANRTLLYAEDKSELVDTVIAGLADAAIFADIAVGTPNAAGGLTLSARCCANDAAIDARATIDAATLTAMTGAFDLDRVFVRDAGEAGAMLAVPIRHEHCLWAVLIFYPAPGQRVGDDGLVLIGRIGSWIEAGVEAIAGRTSEADTRQHLEYLAHHDSLTGLPNRTAVRDRLPDYLARARRNAWRVAVAMIDLDDFKPVNDRWGHAAGDRLLQSFSKRMRAALRSTDMLGRVGGDEFLLIVENSGSSADLEMLLVRLGAVLAEPFDIGCEAPVSLRWSVGLTVFPNDPAEPDQLLRHADHALCSLKREKWDRDRWWRIWDPDASAAGPDARIGLEGWIDPYGTQASDLLGRVGRLLDLGLDEAMQILDAALADENQSHGLPRWMTAAELQVFKARVRAHLAWLMTPDLDAEAHRARSTATARVHAAIGLEAATVVSALDQMTDPLIRHIGCLPWRLRDRHALQSVVLARIRVERTVCIAAERGLIDEGHRWLVDELNTLIESTLSWPDLVQAVIDSLVESPFHVGAAFGRPDEHGTFIFEHTAGCFAEYTTELARRGLRKSVLESAPGYREAPVPKAWRTGEIESNPSYSTLIDAAAWSETASHWGVRSSVAVPLCDADGRSEALLCIFGAYPGQFEHGSARMFLQTLGLMLERGWRGRRRIGFDATPIAAVQRGVYRTQVYGDALEMRYQPIVDLRSGRPYLVEALARLRQADGTVVAPGAFLYAYGAQELHTLFHRGLEIALRQCVDWQRAGLRLDVSVNLPPGVMLEPGFIPAIRDTICRYDVAPQRIVFEITEAEELDHNGALFMTTAASLERMGIALALDDFGTGYSSFSRLRSTPIRTLKIAQDVTRDSQVARVEIPMLLGTLIFLGQSLGMRVVVEGLEDPAQVEAACVLGADAGQGYRFAAPMRGAAVADWISAFRLQRPGDTPQTTLGWLCRRWLKDRMSYAGDGARQRTWGGGCFRDGQARALP